MSTDVLHSDRFAEPLEVRADTARKPPHREADPLNPSLDPLTLKTMLAEAVVGVEQLVFALESFPGRPYIADLERVAGALRRSDIAGALRLRDQIPWVIEGDTAIGGLVVYETRDPQVRRAAQALDRALARVKLYSRHGLVPKT